MATHTKVPVSISAHQSLAAIAALESDPSVRAKLEAWTNIHGTTENSKSPDISMLLSISQSSSQKQAIINWVNSLA